jgi:hypothetical protein
MSKFFNVKTTGIEDAQTRIKLFNVLYPDEAAEALEREANLTMKESKKEVPVDTSALKNSAYVGKPRKNGNIVSIKFGYGGVAVQVNHKSGKLTSVYAMIVHEDLTKTHKVGKAKFLEDPVNRREQKRIHNIHLNIKKALERSGIK